LKQATRNGGHVFCIKISSEIRPDLLVFFHSNSRGSSMKRVSVFPLLFLLCVCSGAIAQDSAPITHPAWNYGLFAGYGNGLLDDTGFHRFTFGGRIGRVLTSEHGGGILRGTFEWGAEATPVEIFNYHEATYAGGIMPVVLKWNFTGGGKRRVAPFLEAVSGALFSADNFPAGDTARVNFQSGAGIGFNAFTRQKRAVTFNLRALHISNASIGNHNPGINASLQVQIGYSWFK
jgi:lipid A 3-O-deacylase